MRQCLSGGYGRVAEDEGRGHDRAGASRVLRARSVDQGDLPGAPRLAQHGSEDPAERGDGVRVRAKRAAATEDRAVAGRTRPSAGGERGPVEPGAADADPPLRGVARAWLRRRLRRGPAVCGGVAARAHRGDGGGLRAAELRAGRGIPVRLEPRDRADRRGDGDGEGGAGPALPQPDAVRAGVSAREPGDGVRRPRPGVRLLQGGLHAGHLRQHEDRGGRDPRGQGAGLQPSLPADVRALPGGAAAIVARTNGATMAAMHAGGRVGERPGREPGRDGAAAVLLAAGPSEEL